MISRSPSDIVTNTRPKTRKRKRRYGLMMLDVEIFDALGVPEKVGRRAFRQLDKRLPNARPFPQPVELFGGRRFWPAVERYFMEEFGSLGSSSQIGWEENFDAPRAKNR